MSLKVTPMSLREANEYVNNFHRHNKETRGHKYSIGASDGKNLVGVAIVGRPVARALDDGYTAEVLRVCVQDDYPKNTCSFLYGRCWRIWQQMGGERMITYTLQEESGSSLKAVNWKIIGEPKARKEGEGWQNRAGRDWQPVYGQLKFRWETTNEER